MAVAWFLNPVLDPHYPIVQRHDRRGITNARRYPAFIYSINKNACLMHRIVEVEMHWYALVGNGSRMGRLKQPAMIARLACGESRPIDPKRTRTCQVPLPNAVLCGRCHGEPATFGRNGAGTKVGMTRAQANVQLGCAVAGYPSALARDEAAT